MASAAKALVYAVLFLTISNFRHSANGDPIVPCYFIFGDSLADNGNNNQLNTQAKANYPPYGADLPACVPRGRFTNGRTMVDLIAQTLGFTDFIVSHAAASGQDILRGINYASASAGIRDESGSNLGIHVSLNAQLAYHKSIVNQIGVLLKDPANASQLLNSCLYTVGMGSNDFLNNYFPPNSSASKQYNNLDLYTSALIDQYGSQLETLHELGARKVALFGLGPLGCTPFIIAKYGRSKTCFKDMNDGAQAFNSKLRSLVDTLNAKFTDSNFTYINVVQTSSSLSLPNGVTEFIKGCCPMTDTGVCVPSSPPCLKRDMHAFFDGFHPTQVVNLLTAARAYKSNSKTDAYPFDISHLVQP